MEATRSDPDRMRDAIGIARKELAGKSVAEWMETLAMISAPPRRQYQLRPWPRNTSARNRSTSRQRAEEGHQNGKPA